MTNQIPTLYTFRRCPYAIRARLSIAYSQQTIIWREVLLKDKPEALISISPKATVPVLQLQNGQVIDESFDIMLWALQKNDPAHWLGQDADEQLHIDTLIQENDSSFKANLDRYKYAIRYPERTEAEHRKQGESFLEDLEQRLKRHSYLIGERKTLADAAIFPFIRQFSGVDPQWFANAPYPHLRHWLNRWLESELFLSVMQKHAPWKKGDMPIKFPLDR